ncbi:MAG: hypothetical protein KC800_00375 [Candidatus Eremiobacteraeota bacterium]|nr:hypothetical protein [Candidatus Eremiobacteraeota bacterium]
MELGGVEGDLNFSSQEFSIADLRFTEICSIDYPGQFPLSVSLTKSKNKSKATVRLDGNESI